jgi:hypothetical protein
MVHPKFGKSSFHQAKSGYQTRIVIHEISQVLYVSQKMKGGWGDRGPKKTGLGEFLWEESDLNFELLTYLAIHKKRPTNAS